MDTIVHRGINDTEFREAVTYIILYTLFLLTQVTFAFCFRASTLYFWLILNLESTDKQSMKLFKLVSSLLCNCFFLTQMQECIYILLIVTGCIPYANHDAKPCEKHKIEGFTSTPKELVLQ